MKIDIIGGLDDGDLRTKLELWREHATVLGDIADSTTPEGRPKKGMKTVHGVKTLYVNPAYAHKYHKSVKKAVAKAENASVVSDVARIIRRLEQVIAKTPDRIVLLIPEAKAKDGRGLDGIDDFYLGYEPSDSYYDDDEYYTEMERQRDERDARDEAVLDPAFQYRVADSDVGAIDDINGVGIGIEDIQDIGAFGLFKPGSAERNLWDMSPGGIVTNVVTGHPQAIKQGATATFQEMQHQINDNNSIGHRIWNMTPVGMAANVALGHGVNPTLQAYGMGTNQSAQLVAAKKAADDKAAEEQKAKYLKYGLVALGVVAVGVIGYMVLKRRK